MATSPFDVLGGGALPPTPPLFGAFDQQGATAPATLPGPASPAPQSPLNFVRETENPDPLPAVQTPISKLRPDSELNRATVEKLDAMFKFSQDKMKFHYDRWNYNEQKVQAFTPMTEYKRLVDQINQQGARPPEPLSVIVPYSYATLHAGATFIASVLLGRKPIFPLMATRGTEVERARYMEQALQSNLDASRGYETLWQHIWDSLNYGFSSNRIGWEERTGQAIRWIGEPTGGRRELITTTTFAGNVVSAIDPYKFFPDPRVPIHQCNERGDFMFTEIETSETILKDMERNGDLMWVNEGMTKSNAGRFSDETADEGRRRIKIGIRGEGIVTPTNVVRFRKLREGTVRLIPKDWNLGDSEQSELWKFTWFRGTQCLQAEPLGMVHAKHPYSASEPTSLGHDFMSLSMADQIGTFQDILSWLVSSRMENVRTAINNQFIADPARVDLNDIRTSPIGRIIRLKQAAMGLPVQEAIQQLVVQDVTQGHLGDIQTMRILADTITGVNDNMRGIQNQGGRRSATEARMSMQAGASRLSQLAVRISSQALHPMVQQMIMNIQQFMPDQMWVETTGDDGQLNSKQMTPEMLTGDFNYQISDGALPFDKTALVEVWKEILMGVAQDPELRAQWDVGKIFEYTAELGGAKNIDSFKKQQGIPIAAGAAADPGNQPGMQALGAAMPAGPISPGGVF